jgi:protein SCO1
VLIRRTLAIAALCTASLTAKSWPVDGIVIALDPVARTMLVSHRPIAKYMDSMAMPFRVEDAHALDGLHPGARVQFDLIVDKEHSIARNIKKAGGLDVPIAAPQEQLPIGARLSEFTLADQQGKTVRLSDFHGKVLAIDFIYTRCPLPDVCPRLSANFSALQKHFRERLGTDLVLLSVTVDPDYDTPAILAEYAKRWGADPRGWRFLTGEVAKTAAQLGEVYWTDEGSIGHNSMTSIITRDGRLAAIVDGSTWRIDQLEQLVSHELEHN